MQPSGGKDMGTDQRVYGGHRLGTGAHPVGQRREADLGPFLGEAFGLTVHAQMLAEPLEKAKLPEQNVPESSGLPRPERWGKRVRGAG